jgi:hypothetical protein
LLFVIPATLLTVIGMAYCLNWLDDAIRSALSREPKRELTGKNTLTTIFSLVLFGILAFGNGFLLRDALVNGPLWYNNYGLGGMQYGASQLFQAATEYQISHPNTHLIISPSWANGTDVLARYFSTEDDQFDLGSIEGYMFEQKLLDENVVFVMIPDEYQKTIESGKFTHISIEQTIPYPDGRAGFYFVRLRYVENINEILSAEQYIRSMLQQAAVTINGEPVQVRYSMLDMGTIDLVFDGNKQTVARTLEANPFIIELTFPAPRKFSGYTMFLGSADIQVATLLYPAQGSQPVEFIATFTGSPSNPELEVSFGQPVTAKVLRFEILAPYAGVPSNVHVWEIGFK